MSENLELLPLTIENFNETMNIHIENIEDIFKYDVLSEAGLKQGIVYNYDSLCFGDIESLNLNTLNILEARFFNDKFEVDIINNGEIHGSIVVEKSKDMIINEKYKIYGESYSELITRTYMGTDEDGQAYVRYVKPCKFSKGGDM